MPTAPDSFTNTQCCPAGSAIPVVNRGRLVVWLCGEIDLTVAPDLAYIASQIDRFGHQLTLDTSRMTFCDGTIGRFVGSLPDGALVTVRRPGRLLLELLLLTGVADRVKLDLSVG